VVKPAAGINGISGYPLFTPGLPRGQSERLIQPETKQRFRWNVYFSAARNYLGGSAGTTFDAFKLISDVQKYGARVALFGRKINLSEHPLTFIEMLRRIVDHQITAEEAVKAYHDALKKLGIKPLREFADDTELTGTMAHYR